ncbi:uncharacterized protein LOC133299591 [Gastrolobium bilobum]|uniref:uncharacterized protein LOC133299591 n=1 Tax=Gastrolobium bilobum TaxID=150636 RepID=UPI002AB151DF|nr:uncharacterized protein LOC133299591 [Gastrolobium bilobum]
MRGTVDPETLIYEPEIERTTKRLRKLTRQRRQAETSTPQFEVETEMAAQDPPAAELMESILALQYIRGVTIVKPSIVANNYDIQPALITLVEKTQFGGEDYEDPHNFIDRFLRIRDTTKHNGVTDDAIRLRLFPFALTRRALKWLDRHAPNNIRTWEELAAKFFAEHFSMENYNKLVNEITNFTQQPGENLCAAWTRFQELIRKCPQYDLSDTKKVRVFYNGVTPNSRMIINGAAGGTIEKKTSAQTLELIDFMARNENASMTIQPVQPKKGILQLRNNDASLAEQKMIFQQLGNETNECPTPMGAESFQVNGVWYDPRPPQNTQSFQRNQNGAQGINFQRRNQGGGLDYKSNNYLQPPPLPHKEPSELEKAMIQLSKTTNDHMQTTDAFMNETRAYNKNQDASIRNLETQIGQHSRQLAERSQERSNAVSKEQCNVITTRNEELEKRKLKFLQERMNKLKRIKKKHRNNLLQFKRNTLEKMPSYAKFLKETLSKKRKLTEDEPITLTEEFSAILQENIPPKLKDPGSFSIPCTIGKTTGELIMRVDGEQAIFKVLINEAPPLPASQPKNQVNYITEKKVEEGNKKEVHQLHEEHKPNVKME